MSPSVSPRVLALPALLVLLVAVAPTARGSQPVRRVQSDGFESAVLTWLNFERAANGLNVFRPSAQLRAAANRHSAEMVQNGYFSHESPDGSDFWRRIQRFYPRKGPGMWTVGENLLWSAQALSARRAVEEWLQSPEHRDNLLNRRFRDVGISAVWAARAPGIFGQRRVVVLTVDFGKR